MARRTVKKVVRKPASKAAPKVTVKNLSVGQVAESAQKVWLAGLGAVAKAQANSGKIAETLADQAGALVAEGKKIEARVMAAATAKAKEAQSVATKFAKAKSAETAQTLGKLEGVFEERVSKTLNTFGIPSSKQVRELIVRMEELQSSLNQLKRARA
ncbi:MAG: phasin family protein [Betaproteobacteria bacterium]|nr:phasin family protein [Betaproteobacteria bacterium]